MHWDKMNFWSVQWKAPFVRVNLHGDGWTNSVQEHEVIAKWMPTDVTLVCMARGRCDRGAEKDGEDLNGIFNFSADPMDIWFDAVKKVKANFIYIIIAIN